MTQEVLDQPIKETVLYNVHVELGAKLVPFGGYRMPVSYPDGIQAEYFAVRKAVGIFDVSHMGEFFISGEDVQEYLLANENRLRSRKGRNFRDHNWWKWSTIRNLDYQAVDDGDCIYVNTKTRNERPFFKASRGYFSGSLLMLDPKDADCDLDSWIEILNDPKIAFENLLKNEGRFDFRQKTVKNILYR